MAYPMYPYQQGYYTPYQTMPQSVPQQQNVLPAQQVLQANGKASIDSLRMSPNSSVLIMDTTAPIVWLCTSDGLGNVTPTPYDITPHKDAKASEINDIETRLLAVEKNVNNIMQKWEDMNNAESDGKHTKSKQTVRNDGENPTA